MATTPPFGRAAESDALGAPGLYEVRAGPQDEPLFCGPAAICAVTGAPVAEIVEVIKMMRHDDTFVSGVLREEMIQTLAELGYHAALSLANTPDSRTGPEPGVRVWLTSRLKPDELNIVIADGEEEWHAFAVCGDRFVDNGNRTPTRFSDSEREFGRVVHVLDVTACALEVTA